MLLSAAIKLAAEMGWRRVFAAPPPEMVVVFTSMGFWRVDEGSCDSGELRELVCQDLDADEEATFPYFETCLVATYVELGERPG